MYLRGKHIFSHKYGGACGQAFARASISANDEGGAAGESGQVKLEAGQAWKHTTTCNVAQHTHACEWKTLKLCAHVNTQKSVDARELTTSLAVAVQRNYIKSTRKVGPANQLGSDWELVVLDRGSHISPSAGVAERHGDSQVNKLARFDEPSYASDEQEGVFVHVRVQVRARV
jgi:hypothetical protein